MAYLEVLAAAAARRGLVDGEYGRQLDQYLTAGSLSCGDRRYLDGLAEVEQTRLLLEWLRDRYGPAVQLGYIAYVDRIGGS